MSPAKRGPKTAGRVVCPRCQAPITQRADGRLWLHKRWEEDAVSAWRQVWCQAPGGGWRRVRVRAHAWRQVWCQAPGEAPVPR